MTSQSLYRKWRSQTFDDLVGQEPIVRTLKNALKSNSLSHAYLFTGPRGTGKTSTARLLAKTVNCEHPRDGEPCNECMQCREITAGSSMNVIEIDAASNRGIDNIRELRERVMVPPATGKYKVYVLDEAHMLTTEAFNALLKTLEEPPDYAIFVLATTEVHKMLPTVISRCQPFYFKRITTRQIVEHLYFVAGQEGIQIERSAAELIARAAAGGMRDALSLLDQALAYAGNTISLAQIQTMLGVADPRTISRCITLIAQQDSSGVLHLINELAESETDLRQVNSQLMEFWRALMLDRAGADAAAILDLTEDETREVKQLSAQFALEELIECARIFAQNELAQKNAGTPQLGLELASLSCIDIHRRALSGQPIVAAPVASTNAPAPTVYTPPARSASAPAPTPAPAPATARADAPAQVRPAPAQPAASQPAASRLPDANEQPGQPTETPTALTVQQIARAWENVRKRTKQKSKSGMLAGYLAYFNVVRVEGTPGEPVVVIQTERLNHLKYVKDEQRYKDLEWALQMEFNLQSCKVHLVLANDAADAAEPPGPTMLHTSSATSEGVMELPTFYEPPSDNSMQQEHAPREEYTSPDAQKPSDIYSLATDAPGTIDDTRTTGTAESSRKHILKEHRPVAGAGAKPEALEHKARRDPVVQEIMRTFAAKIVDIHPKYAPMN